MFLADRDVALADRVERRLTMAADLIGSFPNLGRAAGPGGVRRLSLPDIQYTIDYRVDQDRVLIRKVLSTRQDRERP